MRKSNLAKGNVLIVACVLLAACTGGTTNSQTPSPGATGGQIPEKVLTYAYPKDWPDLDPSVAFSAEPDVLAQIYETLTVFDPRSGNVIPGLATSWEHNADGKQWTFHLRNGVKFQDGSAFTAEAVKFTVERIKRINKGPAYIFDAVTDVKAVDPLTVQFDLS